MNAMRCWKESRYRLESKTCVQSLPVARDKVDALVREAAIPLLAEDEPELMLDVLVRPGSLDAGFGNAVDPGAPIPMREEGGFSTPTSLDIEVVRAVPEGALTGTVAEVADRGPPVVVLGTTGATRSLAAMLGRWIPANREEGAAVSAARAERAPALIPELDVADPEVADEPARGGNPMTRPPAACMPAGGRCTPRIGGRVG